MYRRQRITGASSAVWVGGVLLACACAPRSSAVPAARTPAAQSTSDTGTQRADIVDISAAGPYACAVRADHQVWCWGDFPYWPLGVDPQNRRPLPLAALPPATHVFTGPAGVCATARAGGLYCLGESWLMGLAKPYLVERPPPTRVLDRSPTSVVFSEYHACALEQGAVWCWGDDFDGTWWLGQEGADGVPEPHQPHHVSGLPAIVRVSAGDRLTCGIDAASQLWCWGGELSFEDPASFGTSELIGPRRILELEHDAEALIDSMSNIIVAAGSQIRVMDSTETRTYDFGRLVSSVRAIDAGGTNRVLRDRRRTAGGVHGWRIRADLADAEGGRAARGRRQ